MKNINHIIVVLSLLFSSNFIYGQIDLGIASTFVLFTSAGAIDNVGPSHFDGDIGTNVGAITGFPPGTLTGQIQHENPITLQAAADVEESYNYLTSVSCDSLLGSSLGGGQILTPYVYCILTAASLNGELILDGENNPDALFIIKITGVLDLISLSKITLINSASANNVYWQIDGAVNIGAAAIFNGTILANGALSFADESELYGRGLSRQGAISTLNSVATLPNDFSLPIQLIMFEGENKNTYNLLSWSTASESNNSYFTLERTINGTEYIEIVRLNGAGTSSSIVNYEYSDNDFENEINYYRLTQTDYDGKSESFSLISINNLQPSKSILKIVNIYGQEVGNDYLGLRVIHFNNGKVLKIHGKFVPNL